MAKCAHCGSSGLTLKIDSRGLCPKCHDDLLRKLEEQISTLETVNRQLQSFKDEYQCIPDAKKERDRLIDEANASALATINGANAEAAKIIAEARDEAERIKSEAISIKNSVDLEIKKKLEKAEKNTAQTKHDSYAALAYAETQIAALLAAASKDFAHLGKTSFSNAYSVSQKASRISEADATARFNPITPSEFRKAAKRGYIVFDLETTGLSRTSDRIIEIGAIKYDECRREIDRYHTLVNPDRLIPASATAINHITNTMVANSPRVQEILPDFLAFIEDLPVIAHNAGFDIAFLENAMHRCNISHPTISYADSLAMSRKAYKLDSYKLGSIAEHLKIVTPNAHRSMDDCETLGQIVQNLLEK